MHQSKKQKKFKRQHLLTLLPKNSVTAELGVGTGEFSNLICKITNPQLHYCVDLWGEINQDVQGVYFTDQQTWDKRFEDVKNKLNSYNVKYIRDYTYNLPNYCQPKMFDWVYIDGDHTYDGCMKDLQAVKDLVKDDGMILGHDYKPAWPERPNWGVVEAVTEFVQANNYFLSVVTSEKFPSYVITKSKTQHEKIKSQAKNLKNN